MTAQARATTAAHAQAEIERDAIATATRRTPLPGIDHKRAKLKHKSVPGYLLTYLDNT